MGNYYVMCVCAHLDFDRETVGSGSSDFHGRNNFNLWANMCDPVFAGSKEWRFFIGGK